MKRLRKSIQLPLIIISLFLCLSVCSPSTTNAGGLKVFNLSCSEYSPKQISIEGRNIALLDIPQSEEYNYICMAIRDGNGNDRLCEYLERNNSGYVVLSVDRGLSGEFNLNIFRSEGYYDPYTLVFSGIPLSIHNGEISITSSSALENNLSLSKEESDDEQALRYYLRPSQGIQSDDERIKEITNKITANISDEYEKALAIHDWICNNIYYDYDALNGRTQIDDYSAVGTLVSKRSVCEGYANLMTALLRAAGIPAKKVSGNALGISDGKVSSESSPYGNHSWNEAFINGRWVIIDSTWDSANNYENGVFVSNGGCYRHTYFDIAQDYFALDHTVLKSNNYKRLYLYINYPKYRSDDYFDHEGEGGWKTFSTNGICPIIRGGSVLIPIIPVIEEMGGIVDYTPETSNYLARLTCLLNDIFAQMWIGSNLLLINDTELQFDIGPQIIDGNIMVPANTLLEKMGCDVIWEDQADNWNGRLIIGYVK